MDREPPAESSRSAAEQSEEPRLDHPEYEPWQSPRRSRRWLWLVGVLLVVAAAAYYFFSTTRRAAPPEPATQPPTRQLPQRQQEPLPEVELPALDASDEFVRERVAALSSDPAWRSWLRGDDLVRRFVLAVLGASEGRSPLRQWAVAAPSEPFAPDRQDGQAVLGESSWRRFDGTVDLVVSIDTARAARLVRTLLPLMERAWDELGFRDEPFSAGVRRALRSLRDAPRPQGPILLEPATAGWRYVDPELESLRPIDKLLLRIGPRNRQRLVDKISAIARQAGLLPA